VRRAALPLAALALLAGLLAWPGERAAAVPTGSGTYVWSQTLDRGDRFQLVAASGETGQVQRVLAAETYGRGAVSPDGRRVAFSAPLGPASLGRYGLFVIGVDGSGLVQVTAPGVGDFDPAWGPDGSWLVVSRDERGNFEPSCCVLWRISLTGGGEQRLHEATSASQPAVSPDGTTVAYRAPDGVRVVASGGGPTRLVAAGPLSWPAFSPDGRVLAVVRAQGRDTGTVSLVEVAGGPLLDTPAGTGGGLPESPVWADDQTLVHLNVWGEGENGRTRAEIRHTTIVAGGGSTAVHATGRPMYYLHWGGAWRRGLPAASARDVADACPDDVPPAGFSDVPDGVHRRAVDCVVHWQVAQGRSPGRYEPLAVVSRAQMASFLARLVTASGGTLPEPTRDHFPDDAGSVHEDSINRLAEAGLVRGTADGRYGPADPVSRAQMAAFLVRVHDHRAAQEGQAALAPSEDWFYDDGSSPLHDDINKAAGAGIASGTGHGRYGPGDGVRRDQMASFLARLLDVLVEGGMAEVPPRA